eukprot:174082-Pelagomonas_calceolata.AAC.3
MLAHSLTWGTQNQWDQCTAFFRTIPTYGTLEQLGCILTTDVEAFVGAMPKDKELSKKVGAALVRAELRYQFLTGACASYHSIANSLKPSAAIAFP